MSVFRKVKTRVEDTVVEGPTSYRRAAKQFALLFKPYRYLVIVAVAFNIIGSLCYICIPYLTAVAIDNLIQVIQGTTGDVLVKVMIAVKRPLGIILLLAGLTFILTYIEERIMARVGEKVAYRLRKKLTKKLNKLPLSYYDNVKVGELLTKATADVDKVAEVILAGFNQLIYAVITIVAGFSILFYIAPKMTVVVLVIILFCLYVTSKVSQINQRLYRRNMTTLATLGGKAEEYFSGNLEIKVFNQQEHVISHLDMLIEKQYRSHRLFQFVNFSIYPLMRLINHLGFVICAVWGGYLTAGGFLTIGILQAYLQYVVQISEPITQSAYLINLFQIGLAAVERVFEVLDVEEERNTEYSDIELKEPQGAIHFDQVSFGYSPDQLVLKEVSFSVHPGERIAIVGETGSGKTTLVNLLMRFYDVSEGAICFDNQSISQLSKKELRKHLGMVLQDTWLFEGTVADNIRFGTKNATMEEVEIVARKAQCHDFISQLPYGYQTIISSDSGTISQGQQQLLTIARGMLSDPVVLILDEATSNVDTETEVKIQKAMENLLNGRTSFMIAHRLTTIRGADRIMLLDRGILVESGSHQELLGLKGRYFDLVNSQGQLQV